VNRLGAPSGKTMCMFIDDLNMPALDKYGSQPPIELLRQVIDQGGFYDRQKLFFKYVANCTFAAACAPPGGGRCVTWVQPGGPQPLLPPPSPLHSRMLQCPLECSFAFVRTSTLCHVGTR
jgi:hypothetical protein